MPARRTNTIAQVDAFLADRKHVVPGDVFKLFVDYQNVDDGMGSQLEGQELESRWLQDADHPDSLALLPDAQASDDETESGDGNGGALTLETMERDDPQSTYSFDEGSWENDMNILEVLMTLSKRMQNQVLTETIQNSKDKLMRQMRHAKPEILAAMESAYGDKKRALAKEQCLVSLTDRANAALKQLSKTAQRSTATAKTSVASTLPPLPVLHAPASRPTLTPATSDTSTSSCSSSHGFSSLWCA